MARSDIKVLLADDDEDDRSLFEEALDEISVKSDVATVKDGVELMRYLKELNGQMPDLLFLDLNMPKKGGLECLEDIRKQQKFKDLSIAIYSTSASDVDIEESFVKGANVYIRKPSDYNSLKKILEHVLKIKWNYVTSNLNRENFLLNLE